MSESIEARLRRMNDELLMVGNEYQSPPCSCGYSRCVEGGE